MFRLRVRTEGDVYTGSSIDGMTIPYPEEAIKALQRSYESGTRPQREGTLSRLNVDWNSFENNGTLLRIFHDPLGYL